MTSPTSVKTTNVTPHQSGIVSQIGQNRHDKRQGQRHHGHGDKKSFQDEIQDDEEAHGAKIMNPIIAVTRTEVKNPFQLLVVAKSNPSERNGVLGTHRITELTPNAVL